MLNFPIQNIANIGKTIYLFNRQKDGSLTIQQDNIFNPYFYEEDNKGIYLTIDGKKVSKINCRDDYQRKNQRTETSYEADIPITKRYIIDKIGEILPSQTKYLFIDVEMKTKELPHYTNPDKVITCVSIYNSAEKNIRNWYIKDYLDPRITSKDWTEPEDKLLKNVVRYIKDSQPDILLGWNFVEFDYPYLAERIRRLWNLDLAELISPINGTRYGKITKEGEPKYPNYPQGISILDYLELFKKIYKSEPSNALDDVAHKYIGTEKNKKVDFNQISDEIRDKNIEDIKKMVKIEEKLNLIPYYDEIRRMGKCLWEDLALNSKVLDMMLLSEAKAKGIVLPSKHYGENIIEEIEFEGAYRRAELGRFENLYKLDLSSAYPMAIIELCLDIANLTQNKNEQKIDITDRESNEVKYSVYFKQNSNALLPTLARKLIIKKDYIKKQLKSLDPESSEAKDLQLKYDAVKALVNSLFGVTALKIFRLYNVNIASAITSIVRDVLHYVEVGLQSQGMKVIYLDTDSVFVEAKENPVELCNQLVKKWAKEKYNKDNTGIEFDLEGTFEQILVVALCHYKGRLRKPDGKLKIETKGIEAKRKDSSKFMQVFQGKLIDKILDNEPQSQIVEFINAEKERIKTVPIAEIGFPCKINNTKEYKSIPIFVRALEYSKELCGFTKVAGDTFYYIYVEPFGKAIRKATRSMKNKETGKKEEKSSEKEINKNVLAYDDEQFDHVKNIDWKKMESRTIIDKCEHIFIALGWDLSLIKEVKVKKND